MSKVTVTFEMLFEMLHELNRACPEGKYYRIMLDMKSFHLCVNGETIYQSFNAEDFFGRMYLEFCCVCYPREPEPFDWL